MALKSIEDLKKCLTVYEYEALGAAIKKIPVAPSLIECDSRGECRRWKTRVRFEKNLSGVQWCFLEVDCLSELNFRFAATEGDLRIQALNVTPRFLQMMEPFLIPASKPKRRGA